MKELIANLYLSIGYLVEVPLKTNLTEIQEFHSEIEDLSKIFDNNRTMEDQISFAYPAARGTKVIPITGFSKELDPTRMFSLHCALFPLTSWCADLSLYYET